MLKIHIFMLFIIAVSAAVVNCQNRGTRSQPGVKQPARYSSLGNHGPNVYTSPSPVKQYSQPMSYGGVGAWGYMAIILTIVLSGIGAYYVILLYPVMCKKERMYDVMEMTAV